MVILGRKWEKERRIMDKNDAFFIFLQKNNKSKKGSSYRIYYMPYNNYPI